jgi:hypothetical protein
MKDYNLIFISVLKGIMTDRVRHDTPSERCHATKEELLNSSRTPLFIDDDCPICQTWGVLCHVGSHPSIPIAGGGGTGKKYIRL